MKDYMVTIKVASLDYRGTFFAPNQRGAAEAKAFALLQSRVWNEVNLAIEYTVHEVAGCESGFKHGAVATLAAGAVMLALAVASPAAAQTAAVRAAAEAETAASHERVLNLACQKLAAQNPNLLAYSPACAGRASGGGPDPETIRNLVERQRQLDARAFEAARRRCDSVRSDKATPALLAFCASL